MFQGNRTSNLVSKWCKTVIISTSRRPTSYLKTWLKTLTSILVHPSRIFNLPEKCSLSFTSILLNAFPHIIWKLKDLHKTKPFYNICAYRHAHFNSQTKSFQAEESDLKINGLRGFQHPLLHLEAKGGLFLRTVRCILGSIRRTLS